MDRMYFSRKTRLLGKELEPTLHYIYEWCNSKFSFCVIFFANHGSKFLQTDLVISWGITFFKYAFSLLFSDTRHQLKSKHNFQIIINVNQQKVGKSILLSTWSNSSRLKNPSLSKSNFLKACSTWSIFVALEFEVDEAFWN